MFPVNGMNTSREKGRAVSSLNEIWLSLLDEEIIQSKEIDDDYQGLMMLLETALRKGKSLSNNNWKLKTSNERILKELEWKTQEFNKLKIENHRLENTPCQKCSSLEAEMRNLRKKATEAQSRMKSIANILRLGENIEDSQSPRKNSALTLVSQMLLEESPRRKKRCIPRINSWKETVDNEDEMRNCTTLVPENIQVEDHLKSVSNKVTEKTEIITSPGDVLIHKPRDNISKPLTISLPTLIKESPSRARKNLCTNFDNDGVKRKDSLKIIPETEQNSLELNGSLAEYVKEANSELDKIWFTASSSKSLDKSVNPDGKETLMSKGETIIASTPERTPQKKTTVWKMKEVRGPSEQAGNRKFRQMTLSLSHKLKTKEVDLSTLSGFDGGSLDPSVDQPLKNSDISDEVRAPLQSRDNFDVPHSSSEEFNLEINTNAFQPAVTSTQLVNLGPTSSKERIEESPNYKYRRDTVRKRSERAKLEGWDCTKCAEYYTACGETSPSKVKGRMNKCSRHRDKFKPTSNTPPGYWNPIFPDTEQCKEQKMYTSIHCKRGDL